MNLKQLTIYLLILLIQILALYKVNVVEMWEVVAILSLTNILAELVYKIVK